MTGPTITGFHNCHYPASYTYISVSSGRSEKAKAPIVSNATFSEIKLRETKMKNETHIQKIQTYPLTYFVSTRWGQAYASSVWVMSFLRVCSSSCSITKTKHTSTWAKIRHEQWLLGNCILTCQWAEGGRQRQTHRCSPACRSPIW